MLCGTVFADDLSKTLTMNTAAGYAELTVTKAGTSSTGGDFEISKDGIIVTSDKGYIKDHEMTIYKTGVMKVCLGETLAGNHITKVVLNVSNYHFSPSVDGWTAGDTYQTTDKITGDNAEEFTPSSNDKTYIVLTNVSTGKTTVKSITVYYAADAAPNPEPAPAGYTVDFNKAITTSSHDFVLGSNWGHVVGTNNYDGYGPYYMSYGYTADGGFNGTGSLYAYRQYAGDNYGGGECYDLLVTPLVSGEITLKVKAHSSASNSNPSFVEIYKIDAAGTTRGDLIQRFTAAEGYTDIEGQEDWKQISLTLAEEQRIAIRAQYVYMDDFTAAAVNIIPQKSLSVVSVMNMEGKEGTGGTTTYFEQQADGTLSVPLKVLLSNTGDVDFVAGTTENYTLTLASAGTTSGAKTYFDDATVAIPVSLAAGASDTVDVTFNIPYTSGWKYYFVKENVSGTTSSSSRYAGVTAYEPKFVFRAAESTSTSSLSAAQAFGLISENTTKSFEIANTGTAPLIIKSITLPTGFTSANMPEIPAGGLSIAKGATQTLDITLPATTQGAFSGNLTIVYLDKNAAEQTYTLAFSGNVLPAGTWAADFAGDDAIGYPAGSIAEGGINSDYQYADGAYNYYIKGRTTSSYATGSNMFITPKLHATAGQTLTFDVKGYYGSSYYAKVYVSTDRKTWGEPKAYFTYGTTEGAEAIGSSDWVNKSITFDAEGDYYVAFSLYGEFKIDNIIGLTKADVAHDLYIKSVNWPDASVKSGTSLSRPSIDIIPLTNETAESYTVKYVCGETVLAEGTPVALTASANSSKSFSFSWTPVVESTTAYNGSKVVFEFTDGTKFESETFDLTVTNEPIFHFVSSIPSSKWYEPSDVSTPIAFGKTNQEDKKTFYVYNWGSAPLTVKSIAVPAGFTATPAEQFIVPAFNENDLNVAAQAVEITFSATEAGTYSGDSLVVTYLDGTGAEKTFKLAISGTKLDPTKWYANFGSESNQWPAGSVYQDNVSTTYVNTGDYAITSSSTTKNIFVTPKLTAAAGEKLMFDAKLYNSSWNEGKVVVYAAATREEVLNAEEGTTRDTLFSVSGQDAENAMTTNFQTFEVTVPTAGDYFFGFEISNRPYVDEIYGLKPAAVAHDWTIVSSNVPTEAMQNVASTATVNILNLGLADEAAGSYTATLFVNGEAAATADAVAIPMSHKLSDAGTQLSFSFRYPKAGTFPVYIEVKAGDYSVKTTPVDVVFAEEVAVAEAIAIGTKSGNGRDYGFVDWYNNDGSATRYTDIVYPATKLTAAGLKVGDKINSIAFRASNSAKTLKAVVTSWVGLSTGEVTLGTPDKTAMTEVAIYNGEVSLPANFESVINISANPIVWDGTSDIRVYTEAVGQGSQQWIQATYDYDSEITMSYNGSTKAAPLAYFTLAAEPATFAGTVKNAEGTAVEGATVTLISNDGDGVEYTGKTNAEGAYTINVIQASRSYNVEVEAEGYKTESAIDISFAEGNITKDFVMVFDPSTALANADFEGETSVYSNPKSDRAIYQPTGWTVAYENGEENDMTALNSSSLAWNSFSGRPQLSTGGNSTYWVRFRWGSSENLTLSQTVTLPAGEYRMTADAFFNGADGGSATISAAGVNKSISGNSTWSNYSLDFTLTEKTAVTVAFNVKQTKQVENVAAFDNFKLGYLADVVKVDLQTEIDKAIALMTPERTEGLTEFNTAIEAAEALLTSTVIADINAGIDELKTAETAFLTANLPVAEGTYYVYNPLTEKFLSRGNAYGTAAIVDDYGMAINVTATDLTTASYKLSSFDNGAAYGFDAWMYADAGGNDVRTYNINKVGRGFTLTNTNNNQLVYVYMKDGADKFRVAGNAIMGDNYDNDAQTVWQFITKEDRDAIVARREGAQKLVAFTSAGIAEDAQVEVAEPTLVSFTSGNAWTQTITRSQGGQPATNDNGTEMWQATGNFTQTVNNVIPGLYKVSIQAFYRNGGSDDCVARYNTGYNTVLAYLEANGNKVQVKSWAADKGEGNNPNSMGEAKAKFDEGKYLAETYAYVGTDSVLNLTVNNPAFIGNGWFIVGNVKYAKVEKATLAGDANLDGDVTTSDAVAAVNFALEKETPSEKAFKAADVNNSNSITVSDAVGIVNIALGKQNGDETATARGSEMAVNYLTMNGASLNLMNSTEFVGFQMDVTLANGAQFNGVQLADRAAGLQVIYNRISANTYRIIAFSTGNAAIEGNEGELFTLDIAGNHNINITNIEFADATAQAYAIGFAETTGINGIYAGAANVESYTVGGVKNDKVRKGMNIVRTADGKVKKVFVK